jgi:hypothetical protein
VRPILKPGDAPAVMHASRTSGSEGKSRASLRPPVWGWCAAGEGRFPAGDVISDDPMRLRGDACGFAA